MSRSATQPGAGPFRPPSVPFATIGLALAVFMQVLDGTIANVALPTIAGNLGVSPNQGTWVITTFSVANAIALPLTGFLVRRFGQVPLFLAATLAFTLASLLCGTAQSLEMLVLFRALQGAVAGPMIPTTQALMLSIYPPDQRGLALSLIAMVTVVAPIAGPLLGGWITESYSWRWAFFINIPVGLFACLTTARQMRGRPEMTEPARVDVWGLVALVVGVGALQLVLDKGNDEDWFHSTAIIGATIAAVLGIAVFLVLELTERHPIVDLRLFRHRNFAIGGLTLMLAYSAFFAVNVIVPLWLQRTLGYTALWAGLAVAPMGLVPIALTSVMGRHARRFNMRLLVSVAFAILGTASVLRSGFVVQTGFPHIAWIQLLQGLGLALFTTPINSILLSDLGPDEIAAGSGLATFLRTMGASFAVSVTTLLWDRRTVFHHAILADQISLHDPATRQALAGIAPGQPLLADALLNETIGRQAEQIAFNEASFALGCVFLAAIALVWLTKPASGAGPRR